MSVMRKPGIDIQEIGYGYFPLAWATTGSASLGIEEIGQTLSRLPDTFYYSGRWYELPGFSLLCKILLYAGCIIARIYSVYCCSHSTALWLALFVFFCM